jgi:hypothetical protein
MTSQKKINLVVLWSARILGSLILAFVLFFLLAHIFGEEEAGNGFQNTQEVITFLFFPFSLVIGLSLAFKWEGLGGIITLVGMIGLFVLRPDLLRNFYMLIFIIPGILYTLYWLMNRDKATTSQYYSHS